MHKIISNIKADIKASIPTIIYFLVAFHVLAFTRKLVQDSYGITLVDSSAATIGALIVAKAIVIVNKLRVANWLEQRPLVFGIFWKSLLYSVFAWLFRFTEEFVQLISKYGSIEIAGPHLLTELVWSRFWALNILLFILLILYCSAVELIRVLGAEKVTTIFFGSPDSKS